MKGSNHPFVTVMVPTYNREDLLQQCLASLFAQTYPKHCYEIIVVDDGSTDGTESVVQHIAQTTRPRVCYLRQDNKGPAAARNLAVKNARGEILAFTDDDCVASPTWIQNGVSSFADDGIVGVEGRTLPAEPVRFQVLPPRFSYTLQVTDESWTYPTCNMFYRKRAILDVGGFNERYRTAGPEDTDLAWRITERGMKIVFSRHPLVYHAVHYDTLTDRLRSMKRYQFEPLLFRDHPYLRKNLLFGFVYSKEIIHAPFFALATVAVFVALLRGVLLLPAAILVLTWIIVYLWSNVLVDRNIRLFPIRMVLFPIKVLLHSSKFFHRLVGSVKYARLVI